MASIDSVRLPQFLSCCFELANASIDRLNSRFKHHDGGGVTTSIDQFETARLRLVSITVGVPLCDQLVQTLVDCHGAL